MGTRSPNSPRVAVVVALALVFAFTFGARLAVALWVTDAANAGVKDVLDPALTAEALAVAVAAAWCWVVR